MPLAIDGPPLGEEYQFTKPPAPAMSTPELPPQTIEDELTATGATVVFSIRPIISADEVKAFFITIAPLKVILTIALFTDSGTIRVDRAILPLITVSSLNQLGASPLESCPQYVQLRPPPKT